jgi:hypothetical protein
MLLWLVAWLVACSASPCGVEAGDDCTTVATTESDEPEDTAVELGDLVVHAKVEECTGPEWLYSFDLSDRPGAAELAITGVLADGERADETHPLDLSATAHWEATPRSWWRTARRSRAPRPASAATARTP